MTYVFYIVLRVLSTKSGYISSCVRHYAGSEIASSPVLCVGVLDPGSAAGQARRDIQNAAGALASVSNLRR